MFHREPFIVHYVHSVTNFTLKLFADDITVYKVASNVSDCQLLQDDLSQLYD